ncbi:MAG: hypothetical protein ACKVHE_23185 [Planctomycetales bacterium]
MAESSLMAGELNIEYRTRYVEVRSVSELQLSTYLVRYSRFLV